MLEDDEAPTEGEVAFEPSLYIFMFLYNETHNPEY